ncbi:8729_t:CDS:2, partial [Racocetra persica]
SDPNPLDPNRDIVLVTRWVRTDESASFTQQQLKQFREAQRQNIINNSVLYNSLLQNPEATPNISAKVWNSIARNDNVSSVFQAPDAIHFFGGSENMRSHMMQIAFKIDPDFSNLAAEFSYIIQTIYEFAKKRKFPFNQFLHIRIIKSSEALLSNTFDHDPETLYCQIDFVTNLGTSGWEEFAQLMAQRYFDKYKAKPHWGKQWEIIPNVQSYLSGVLSDQIKQFEKVRAKHDPDKIFFDNKSLQDIFSLALSS